MKLICLVLTTLAIPSICFSATINVPKDQPYIQSGIDAAVNGDTVLVAPGTYVENIDFKGKTITVKSSGGAGVTIIDGGNPANPDFKSAVLFQSGEGPDSVLEGFELTNGSGSKVKIKPGFWFHCGGGVCCVNRSSPTILNLKISNNTAYQGGGIYCNDKSLPIISKCLITKNSVTVKGGGISCENGSAATIKDTILESNEAIHEGGGIYCYEASPSIINSTIRGNKSRSGGGAYFFHLSWPNIEYTTITSNVATKKGGGIHCQASSLAKITNSSITLNTAIWGGGIYSHSSDPIVANTCITGNTVKYDGGGIDCVSGSLVRFKDCEISGNMAARGGGISCYSHGDANVINTVIRGNTADQGGGLSCVDWSDLTLENTLVTGNTADQGGGIFCAEYSPLSITNTTISGNLAHTKGGGVCCTENVISSIINSILWENSAPTGPEIWIGTISKPSTLTLEYSNVKGGIIKIFLDLNCILKGGTGVIDSDPLFVDAAKEDYHLTHTSPCKDAGSNSATIERYDIEMDPRIVGGNVDMGADEFHRHLYFTGDASPGGSLDLNFIDTPNTAPVILWLGSGVLNTPMVLPPHGEWHLKFPLLMEAQLGSIPGPDGVLSLPCTIPSNIPVPLELPLQAGFGTQLTNLCVITLK